MRIPRQSRLLRIRTETASPRPTALRLQERLSRHPLLTTDTTTPRSNVVASASVKHSDSETTPSGSFEDSEPFWWAWNEEAAHASPKVRGEPRILAAYLMALRDVSKDEPQLVFEVSSENWELDEPPVTLRAGLFDDVAVEPFIATTLELLSPGADVLASLVPSGDESRAVFRRLSSVIQAGLPFGVVLDGLGVWRPVERTSHRLRLCGELSLLDDGAGRYGHALFWLDVESDSHPEQGSWRCYFNALPGSPRRQNIAAGLVQPEQVSWSSERSGTLRLKAGVLEVRPARVDLAETRSS